MVLNSQDLTKYIHILRQQYLTYRVEIYLKFPISLSGQTKSLIRERYGVRMCERNTATRQHVGQYRHQRCAYYTFCTLLFLLWYISASCTALSNSFFFSSNGWPLPPITMMGWVRYGWIFSTLSKWKITRSTSLGSLWVHREDRNSGIFFLLPLHEKKAGMNLWTSGFWAMFPRTRFNWHLMFKAGNMRVSKAIVKCFLQMPCLIKCQGLGFITKREAWNKTVRGQKEKRRRHRKLWDRVKTINVHS